MCTKGRCLAVAGGFLVFIGFVMTIYGFTVTPFWDEQTAQGCGFCREARENTLRNTENCRIAGPIFLAIGALVIITAIVKIRNEYASSPNRSGVVMTPYSSTGTTTTGTTVQPTPGTNLQQGPYPYPHKLGAQNPPPAQHAPYPPPTGGSYQQGYPQSGGYPPSAQGYSSPAQGYLPPAQIYPPLSQGYPPPAQGYPPPVQGYPPPAQVQSPPMQGYAVPAENGAPPPPYTEKPSAPPQ